MHFVNIHGSRVNILCKTFLLPLVIAPLVALDIINLGSCKIDFESKEETLEIYCTCSVKTVGKTGAEMEALTGVSVALLTIYDMCKALDKTMEIGEIYLAEKDGGKSGHILNER